MGDAIESNLSPSATPTLNYAAASQMVSPRLTSLDVFRGLVILAMLIVNNIGDGATTGYFWKHADWPQMTWTDSWRIWWHRTTGLPWSDEARQQFIRDAPPVPTIYPGLGDQTFWNYRRGLDKQRYYAAYNALSWNTSDVPFPLLSFCTFADFVMPSFMLIIGVAIPFSVAAVNRQGTPPQTMWIRAARRAALLVVLGWILCYFRDQFAVSLYGTTTWKFSLGMDVLQLLGMGYLVARIIYELPAIPRFLVAVALLAYHWAILRFYPQAPIPAGAFLQNFNALQYIYDHCSIWKFITIHIGPLTVAWRGLMSVPPAVATMVLGTLIGDWLRRKEVLPSVRAKRLAVAGVVGMVLGFLWAFSLPFNKPVWTPSYLVYVSGFDAVCISLLYWLIDIRGFRGWCYPLIVFGTNALALYFLSILFKVLLLNTPRIRGTRLIDILLTDLKSNLGNWAGGWTFTILYVGMWWILMDQLYRRKIFWKL